MNDFHRIARHHASVLREDVQARGVSQLRPRTQRRAHSLLWAPVAAIIVFAVFLPLIILMGQPHGSQRTARPAATTLEPQGTYFDPPRSIGADATDFDLTFLDGDQVQVHLPNSIAQRIESFVPGGAVGWDEGICCSRSLNILFGSRDHVYGGRIPDDTLMDASGRPVYVYRNEPNVDRLVFQFGSWVVEAWDDGPNGEVFTDAQRKRFASLLDGHDASDGFLVLSPAPPMSLRPSDSPDGILATADGHAIVGILRQRGCMAGDLRTSNGYHVRVIPESGLTEFCSDSSQITLWIARTDLSQAELDAVDLGG